ncbi:DgyrCDS117 [Dimorphilus gyrociliatus]|uniref:DgyrCDS117 n=1 Tax=Dimorphilus gyrociliatus TaxID=2664684 RepID=A0A7I8V671_9ANNE|nr:DgyrCDS117 [Dimorphilus gyrociliatus]
MTERGNSTNYKIDYKAPEHPLPDEIQDMERDETVCKFCGVSYLIHNEIKALEDKLKLTEERLKHLEGCEDREKEAWERAREAENNLVAVKSKLKEGDFKIETLQNQLMTLKPIKEELENLKIDRENQHATIQTYKEIIQQFHGIQNNLSSLKNDLYNFKTDCQRSNDSFYNNFDKVQAYISKINEADRSNQEIVESIQLRNTTLEKEIEKCRFNEKLSEDLDKWKNSAQNSEIRIGALNETVENLNNQIRLLQLEKNQGDHQSRTRISDLENIISQRRAKEASVEERCNFLENQVSETEKILEERIKECSELRRIQQERKNEEESARRQASLTNDKVNELLSEMQICKNDNEALKQEREVLITAHHNRMEELRESYRKKIAEAEKSPKQLEKLLETEKSRHAISLSKLENELKEQYDLQLQIQRQKHDKLLESYKNENRQQEYLILKNAQGKFEDEINHLHKKLAEAKAKNCENEAGFRREIEQLKAIIRTLESKQNQANASNDKVLRDFKEKNEKLEREIKMISEDLENKTNQLSKSRTEIQFLQETVRKECEERFELTEALNEAKEELLKLKRPAGGYSTSRSKVTTPRMSAPSTKEELVVFKKSKEVWTGNGRRHSTQSEPPRVNGEDINTVNVSFKADNDKASKNTPLGKILKPLNSSGK